MSTDWKKISRKAAKPAKADAGLTPNGPVFRDFKYSRLVSAGEYTAHIQRKCPTLCIETGSLPSVGQEDDGGIVPSAALPVAFFASLRLGERLNVNGLEEDITQSRQARQGRRRPCPQRPRLSRFQVFSAGFRGRIACTYP